VSSPAPLEDVRSALVVAAHPDGAGADAPAAVFPDSRNPHAHREVRDVAGLDPWAVDTG
jgi:hypothetical protein